MIVFATGYQPVVPFLDDGLIYDADGPLALLPARRRIPSTPGLFAAGLVQANGSMWRIADYQGQLIANLIVAEAKAPDYAARFLAGMASDGDVRAPRHVPGLRPASPGGQLLRLPPPAQTSHPALRPGAQDASRPAAAPAGRPSRVVRRRERAEEMAG